MEERNLLIYRRAKDRKAVTGITVHQTIRVSEDIQAYLLLKHYSKQFTQVFITSEAMPYMDKHLLKLIENLFGVSIKKVPPSGRVGSTTKAREYKPPKRGEADPQDWAKIRREKQLTAAEKRKELLRKQLEDDPYFLEKRKKARDGIL